MKILTFNAQSEEIMGTGTAVLYPDSSVITSGKPLVLPDWSKAFATQVALGVRICRLGKHVALRFAHRYWDAATMCLVTTSTDDQRHDALSQAFDGAIAQGKWVQMQHPAIIKPEVRFNGQVWTLPSLSLEELVNKAIVAASERMTIKMGDIFCLKLGQPRDIAIGDTLTGKINEQEILSIRIK